MMPNLVKNCNKGQPSSRPVTGGAGVSGLMWPNVHDGILFFFFDNFSSMLVLLRTLQEIC